MSGGIYWLASYPKSGNTWTRAFITNLRHEEPPEEGVDINALHTGAIASGREWVDEVLGFDSGDLSHDEVDLLRPDCYRWQASQCEELEYHKIHDAYTLLPNGEPLIPANATIGALYLLRNPLDVAISLSHHNHCSIDHAIESLGKHDYAFCGNMNCQPNQLRQRLLSWSEHVTSWADATALNRLVIRYEDMKLRPLETFIRMAYFLELPSEPKKVQEALDRCAFDKLKQQEKEKGFKEKSPKHESFFRKGIIGDWQETLSQKQIERIVDDHREVMRRFGYLDEADNPVVEPIIAAEELQ